MGVDLGVANTVTTSDGDHLHCPGLTATETARKKRLQRRMARQVKGSKRRDRTRAKIARLCAREADRRKDWIEQTTTALVRDHDLIAVEDLRVKNMLRSAKGTVDRPGVNVAAKRGLNRQIHQQGWARFRTLLTQKAAAATSPCVVVAVNPANTSRRCSGCGYTAGNNRESQAVFVCRACNHTSHADVNAAINICAAGLAVHGRGADVRPGTPGSLEASTGAPTGVKEPVS